MFLSQALPRPARTRTGWTLAQDVQKKDLAGQGAANSQATTKTAASAPATERAEGEGWKKPIPITAGIEYDLVSDYIFRGTNYSDFLRQGREKRVSHQMTTFVEYDTGAFGAIGSYFWFDWYGGPFTGVGR